ncbi:hypothetical protein BKA93DRAFT_737898, partial [Sparassis latifolia]
EESSDRPATVEEIKIANEFIRLLKQATLQNSSLDAETIHQLAHSIESSLDITIPRAILRCQ